MRWRPRRPSGPIRQIGCTLSCLILALPILGSLVHVFASAREKARESTCWSNCKQLGLGVLQYVQDWDETFPPAARWATLTEKYVPKAETWHCADASSPFSYAMNRAAGSLRLDDVDSPADTVLLFEMDAPVKNASGGQHDVVKTWRHYGGNIYVFMDGHANWINEWNGGAAKQLHWQAKTPSEVRQPVSHAPADKSHSK